MEKTEETKENEKTTFKFTKTISCPNCPINCFSLKGALKHAEECNKKRKNGSCCLCKTHSTPDYYDPKNGRYWYLCWKCYTWAKSKTICL